MMKLALQSAESALATMGTTPRPERVTTLPQQQTPAVLTRMRAVPMPGTPKGNRTVAVTLVIAEETTTTTTTKKPNGNPADNNTSGGGASSSSGPSSRPPREPREAREPREPREPRDDKDKVLSKTTLFVANLPFSVDDAQLLAAFAGTKAKAAHVVVTNSGRSRGYGFVEFETEADQLEALKTHNGKSIVGKTGPRNMSVSISHTPPPTSDAPATSN